MTSHPAFSADYQAPQENAVFTFTINNVGELDLPVTSLNASQVNSLSVSVSVNSVDPSSATIPPHGSQNFTVKFNIGCPPEGSDQVETGKFKFTVNVNDAEGPFWVDGCDFEVAGCEELEEEFTVKIKMTECEKCENFQIRQKTPEEIGLCNECVDGHIVPKPVDDNNECTTDYCDPSTGIVHHDPISCPPDDECTDWECDPGSGCYAIHDPECDNFDPLFLHTNTREAPPYTDTAKYFSPFLQDAVRPYAFIDFTLHVDTSIDVIVLDANYQEIAHPLENLSLEAGDHQVYWDGRNDQGDPMPAGSYTLIVRDSEITGWKYVEQVIVLDNDMPEAKVLGVYAEDTDGDGEFETVIKGTAADTNIRYYIIQLDIDTVPFTNFDWYESKVDAVLGVIDQEPPTDEPLTITLLVMDKAWNVSEMQITADASDTFPDSLEIQIVDFSITQEVGGLNTMTFPDDPNIWVDDSLPQSAVDPMGNWSWNDTVKWSGAYSHTHGGGAGKNYHYFIHSSEYLTPSHGWGIDLNTNIIQYVFLPSTNVPQQILVQFYTGTGNGEHRAYWGSPLMDMGGVAGTASYMHMGSMPIHGHWVRLKIPAADIGLVGTQIKGMLFATYGGKAYWDITTTSSDLYEPSESSWSVVYPGDDNTTPVFLKFHTNLPANISLGIEDSDYNIVRHLVDDEYLLNGFHEVEWDNNDDWGTVVNNGQFAYQFSTPDSPIDCDTSDYYSIIYSDTTAPNFTPGAVAVDSSDFIWVADTFNGLIIKLNSEGSAVDQIPFTDEIGGMTTDDSDNLYLTNLTTHSLVKYDSDGNQLFDLGAAELTEPADVCFAEDGLLYIADQGNEAVHVFSTDGVSQDVITPLFPGDDQMISGIAVDSDGTIFISDALNHVIEMFDSDGAYVKTLGQPGDTLGELNQPGDLQLDPNGNIFVVDTGNERLQKFDRNAFYLSAVESVEEQYDFTLPLDIALNSEGHMLIADADEGKLLRYNVARQNFEMERIIAYILVPWPDMLVAGWLNVLGTASARNFWKYSLDYGFGEEPEEWVNVVTSTNEKDNEYSFSGHHDHNSLGTIEPQGGWSPHALGTMIVRLTVDSYDGLTAEYKVRIYWSGLLTCRSGGTISSTDYKVFLTVPAGSMNCSGWLFCIQPTDQERFYDPVLTPVGDYYEFLPPWSTFSIPATLKMHYTDDDRDLDNDGTPDVSESDLAIYEWQPLDQEWTYLGGTVNADEDYVSVQIDRLTRYESFYMIAADTSDVLPPYIYQPESPTGRRLIAVQGESEPCSSVELQVNGESAGLVEADCDLGAFVRNYVELIPGENTLRGKTHSIRGDISGWSPTLSVVYNPETPVSVYSLEFMVSDYTVPLTEAVNTGDTLYLQLVGSDNDAEEIGEIYINLSSSYVDPDGFLVPLTETAASSGIYRGKAEIQEQSSPATLTIGAAQAGEILTAVSEDDPLISDQVSMADDGPPEAPVIDSDSHPSLVQAYFEQSTAGVYPYGSAGAALLRDGSTANSGNYSLKAVNDIQNGDMAILLAEEFDAAENPIVSFAYKINEGVKVNIIALVDGKWYEIVMTDDPMEVEFLGEIIYQTIGDLNVIDDGEWHETEFNLYSMLKNVLTDVPQITVEALIIAEWDQVTWGVVGPGGNNPTGAYYHLDDLYIGAPGNSNYPSFNWTVADDSSGIAGFSYSLTDIPDDIPDEVSEGLENSTSFEWNVPEGTLYFHCRALDGAGNWGDPGHYRISVDRSGPIADSPVPGDGESSSSLEIQLHITDSGGSGVDVETIEIQIEGESYDISCGGLSFDPVQEIMTLKLWMIEPSPPPIEDQQEVEVVLTVADDLAGNPLQSPFSWTWTADFSALAEGDLVLLSSLGGITPTWSPTGDYIAFVSERDGKQEIYVMESDDYTEQGATTVRLTDSPDESISKQPAWSPVDDRIAFASNRDGSSDIWVINADGTGLQKLTLDDPENLFNDTHPTWNPDGNSIAFNRDDALCVINSDGSNPAILLSDGIYNHLEPSWSADGAAVAYTRSLYTDRIRIFNLSNAQDALLADVAPARSSAWSLDSENVLFTFENAIWNASLDGSSTEKLIENYSWQDAHPAWGPQGNVMAFQSTRNGVWNIWLMTVLEVTGVAADPSVFSPNDDGEYDFTEIVYTPSIDNVTVTLRIYNDDDTLVRTIVDDETRNGGENRENWDGRNDYGQLLPSGVYTFTLDIISASGQSEVHEAGQVLLDVGAPETVAEFNGGHYPEGGIDYIAAGTSVSLQAQDTLSDVDVTFWSTDGGTEWHEYASSLQFPAPGAVSMAYYSIDTVANVENEHQKNLYVDNAPPLTELETSEELYSDGTNNYAQSDVTFSLSADDGDGCGVAGIFYTLDGGDQAEYSTPLQFTGEGVHQLSYYSQDNVDNAELPTSLSVIIDDTPPELGYQFVGEHFFNGVIDFITTSTEVHLTANDASSGSDYIEYSINGGDWYEYIDPLTFGTEGAYTIDYHAYDNVGNLSADETIELEAAAEIPTTRIIPDPPLYVKEDVNYAPLSCIFTIETSAEHVEINIDGGGFETYTGPFTLSGEGEHSIEFKGVTGGMDEPASTLVVTVDDTPPASLLDLDLPTYSSDPTYITPENDISISAEDTLSGVDAIEYSLTGPENWTPYLFAFSIVNEGAVTLYYRSSDNVGNVETAQSIDLFVDGIPPSVDPIQPSGELFVHQDQNYATPDLTYSLSGTDEQSGLDYLEYSVNTGNYIEYTGPFSLGTGLKNVEYRGVDNLGNTSEPLLFTVYVDGAAPDSTLVVGNPHYGDDPIYIVSNTFLAISADDGSGSGVAHSYYKIDGAPEFTEFTWPFHLSGDELHTVEFYSIDNLDNTETVKSENLVIDETPPTLSTEVTPPFSGDDLVYVNTGSTIIINAQDDDSGVDVIEYKFGSASFEEYEGPLSLSSPGLKTLYFRARDHLQNRSETDSVRLYLDIEPPETDITAVGDLVTDGIHFYALTTTEFEVTAEDAASGAAEIQVNIDGQGYETYTGPVSFSTLGTHTIAHKAVDNVGNWGEEVIFTVEITDELPSVCLTAIGYVYQNAGGDRWAPSSTLYVLIDTGYQILDEIVYKVDGGDFETYSAPINLSSEGLHSIEFAGVVEGSQLPSTIYEITVDDTPPVTNLELGEPTYQPGAVTYVSADTLFTLTPTDSSSGTSFTRYSLNGGTSYYLYNNPFTLEGHSDGLKQFRFYSEDNVKNKETENSMSIRLDSTPPVANLVPSGVLVEFEGEYYAPLEYTYSLTASDAASGLDYIEVNVDGLGYAVYSAPVGFTTMGLHEIRYKACDILGNFSEEALFEVHVADADLVSKIVPTMQPVMVEDTRVFPSTVKFSLELDSGNEAFLERLEYRIDSGNYTTYFTPFSVTEEGAHTVTYRALDVFGGIEDANTYYFVIDDTPPLLSDAHAAPDPFTPDSEFNVGVDDTATFQMNAVDDLFDSLLFTVEIQNQEAVTVRTLAESLEYDEGIISFVWDGRDDQDETLPEGLYTFLATVSDPVGNEDVITADVNLIKFVLTAQITDEAETQSAPDIDGNRIVWEDYRDGQYDIYLWDGLSENRLNMQLDDQKSPAVSGDLVVWEDYRTGNAEIFLHDLATQSTINITNNAGEQKNPAVSGWTVVWEDDRNGDWDIYSYDYMTGSTVMAAGGAGDQRYPAVWNGNLVWCDDSSGDWEVYYRNLFDQEAPAALNISADAADQLSPDIFGDFIVWEDHRSGNADIYLYDLASQQSSVLSDGPSNQTEPRIFANCVVYTDDNAGTEDTDIFVYYLNGGFSLRITNTLEKQQNPALFGNRIVWQDERDGQWEIYSALIAFMGEEIDSYQHERIDNELEPALTASHILFTAYEGIDGDIFTLALDDYSETPVAEYTTSNQSQPDMFGPLAVWTDNRNGNLDIYSYDIDAMTEERITFNIGNQSAPADRADNWIFFEDDRAGDLDIYGYYLPTDMAYLVAGDPGNQQDPFAQGRFLLYADDSSGDFDIMALDLVSQVAYPIVEAAGDQTMPGSFGRWLIWIDDRNGDKDVYCMDMFTGESQPLIMRPGDQTYAGCHFGRVTCLDTATEETLLADIVTGRIVTAADDDAGKQDTAVYNNRIAWCGYDETDWDLWISELTVTLPPDVEPPEVLNVQLDTPAFSPSGSPGVKDEVGISFNLTDNMCTKLSVTIEVKESAGGTAVRTIDAGLLPTGPNQVYWDGRNDADEFVEDGAYDMIITAYDDAALSGQDDSASVIVDNIEPAVALTQPAQDELVDDVTEVQGTADDDNSIVAITVMVEGVPWSVDSPAAGAYSVQVDILDDPCTLQTFVEDIAGNTGSCDPISVRLDSDGDLLPNSWESAYGLDPYSAEGDDGTDGDPDEDGATNYEEYLAGTDPMNPDSYPTPTPTLTPTVTLTPTASPTLTASPTFTPWHTATPTMTPVVPPVPAFSGFGLLILLALSTLAFLKFKTGRNDHASYREN